MEFRRAHHFGARWVGSLRPDRGCPFTLQSGCPIGPHRPPRVGVPSAPLDEFESLIVDLAPDLIIENHLSTEEVNTTPLRDLIPSIVLREPRPIEGAA